MLTLEAILKAQRQAISYGETGKHYFADHHGPVALNSPRTPEDSGSKSALIRVWDDGLKEFVWKEVL